LATEFWTKFGSKLCGQLQQLAPKHESDFFGWLCRPGIAAIGDLPIAPLGSVSA
jgi:hypothetical protein